MNKYLIVIAGPTAVGKTKTAIEIAKYLNTEIISCDSRQMFKEMQIGTAVPSNEQLKKVKHHFIQTISIHDYYNASMFEFDALDKLEYIYKNKNKVIMTGGSGLYIDAVIKGIDDLPSIDEEVRRSLQLRFENEGLESLRKELKKLDPDYYNQVDLKNHKRILKALEVNVMTGKPYSVFLTGKHKHRDFKTVLIVLNRERSELHERIEKRIDEMIAGGLVEEAKSVFKYKNNNSLNTVGYKEIFEFLEGKYSLESAIGLIKRNTRRYARRQITWFKRYKEAVWFHPDDIQQIIKYINETCLN